MPSVAGRASAGSETWATWERRAGYRWLGHNALFPTRRVALGPILSLDGIASVLHQVPRDPLLDVPHVRPPTAATQFGTFGGLSAFRFRLIVSGVGEHAWPQGPGVSMNCRTAAAKASGASA